MDEVTQAAWEAGPYAKCLRDAAAARAAQSKTAAQLWHECFNEPLRWLDPDGERDRPTETEAIHNVFWACRGASTRWDEWVEARDRVLYSAELTELAEVVETHRREAPPRQMPLPLWPQPGWLSALTLGL